MSSAIDTAFELATRVATKAAQPKPAVSLPAAPEPTTIKAPATDYWAVGGALGYWLTAGQKIAEQATAKQNQIKATDFSNLAPNEVNFVKQALAAWFREDQIKEWIIKLREPVQKKSSFQEFASLPTRFIQWVADVWNWIQKGISKWIDYLFGTNSYGQDVKAGKKSDQITDQLLWPKAPIEDLAREGGRIAGSTIMTPWGGEFATAGKPLLQKAVIKAWQVASEFAWWSIGGLAYEWSKEWPIDWNNVLIWGAISAAFPVVWSVLRGGANLVKAWAEKLWWGPRRLANKLASSWLMNPSAFNRAKDELAMWGIGDEADDVSQFLLQRVRPGNKKEIADQLLNISSHSQEAKKWVLGLSQTTHNPKWAENLISALDEELAWSMSETYNKVATKIVGYANKIKQWVWLTLNELDDVRWMARKYLNPYTASGKVKVAKEDIKEVISSLKSYIEDTAEKEWLGKLAGYEWPDNLIKTLNNQTMVSRTMAEGILRRDSTDAVQQLVTFMSARWAGTILGWISWYQGGPIPDSVPFHTVWNVLIGAFAWALVDNTKVKTTLASWLNKIPKEQKSEIYERMLKKGKPKLSSAAKKEIMQFSQKVQMLLGDKKANFSKTAGKELQGAMKMDKAPEVDKSLEKFFELDSSPDFKQVAPTQILSKPDLQAGKYETKYGTIQNVVYDRGLPKYNVWGKIYDIWELGWIFKKQEAPTVNKAAQDAITTLKGYYDQWGRRAKYIKDFLEETGLAKTVDEIPEDQAENVLDLVRKRKRDDATMAKIDGMKSNIDELDSLAKSDTATQSTISDNLKKLQRERLEQQMDSLDLTPAQKIQFRDWIERLLEWNYTPKVARERFDIPNLEKISFGWSDRDVYALGDKYVLKIAKSARWLAQNSYAEWLLSGDVIPKIIEKGDNYTVFERVKTYSEMSKQEKKIVSDFSKKVQEIGYKLRDYRGWLNRDKVNEMRDFFEESGRGTLNDYDLPSLGIGDISPRNLGIIDWKPILLDEWTINLVDTIEQYKWVKNLDDYDFRDVYERSKRAKKLFWDLDDKTMYSIWWTIASWLSIKQWLENGTNEQNWA